MSDALALALALALVTVATTYAFAAEPWPACQRGQPAFACVVDGDGVHWRGETIRLWRTDAPETHRPHCRAEAEAGARARERLAALLRSGSVAVVTGGVRDPYGRLLAGLTVDGRDVEAAMLAEAVTLPFHTTTRAERTAHWCGR